MANRPKTLKLDAFLPYRMSVASNAVSGLIANAYEAIFGLRIPEWRLVAILAETPGLSQSEVGRRTRMDKLTVSRAAIALMERGLIARARNEEDRRSPLLSLTENGRELYAQVAPRALAFETDIFADFSAAERAALMGLLKRAEAAATRLAAQAGEG